MTLTHLTTFRVTTIVIIMTIMLTNKNNLLQHGILREKIPKMRKMSLKCTHIWEIQMMT